MNKAKIAAVGLALGLASTAFGVERNINVWYPGETAEFKIAPTNVVAGGNYELKVFNWKDVAIITRPYLPECGGRLAFTFEDVGGKFGAYRVQVLSNGQVIGKTAFAFLTSRQVKPASWIGTGGHPLWGRGYLVGDAKDATGPYLDMLSAAGIGVIRQDFGWSAVEREKGKYQMPEQYENFLNQLEKRGIAWNLMIGWENPIYENPLDPDGFAACCAWVAKHWKGRLKRYEIYNEPQHSPFKPRYLPLGYDCNSNLIWVVKFSEFCRKAADAIHEADSEASVAVTGEDVEWLLKNMIELGCAKKGDIVSFHPYCHTQPRPEREYWFKDDGKNLREFAAKHGGATRFCVTEAGWTTFEGKMKYLEMAGAYPRSSFEHQARFLTRMYILAHLTGLEYACQYNWKNEGLKHDYTENNFGQLFYDATPKPAFASTAFLARLLGESTAVGDHSKDRAAYRLAEFDISKGRKVVAAWCIEGEREAELPKFAGMRIVKVLDMFGNLVEANLDASTIHLDENPIYILYKPEARAYRAFGFHFDFHATPADTVGTNLKREDIERICREFEPDFLQVDCKGHPGWASYPSELGNGVPNMTCDTLKLWREVTAKEGVPLYCHYSGVVDTRWGKAHPLETPLNDDGKRCAEWNMSPTRCNGPYVDEVVIPQLKELAGKYGVDGVWIDGDCWGAKTDYDERTLAQFEKETGIELKGVKPYRGTEHFDRYREFCRELYRRYLKRLTTEVHQQYPDFKICSNWAFSDHMPELVFADVDFISGDLAPADSFRSARYAGRAMMQQGKPWDLMAWGFRLGGNETYTDKHAVQLMQEAAAVISLGGGYQTYITQLRDGSPRMDSIMALKPLAKFVREREPYCFQGKAAKRVAILLSAYDRGREAFNLYSRTGMERVMGMTSLVCDAGHVNTIVFEGHLAGNKIDEWPVIIVPELYGGLEPAMAKHLMGYAERGGSLVLTGTNTCMQFASLGVPYKFSPQPAIQNYGKGRIAAISTNIGRTYLGKTQYEHRQLMNEVLSKLYQPRVTVKALGIVEVNELEKNGRLMIQLVNANGNHAAPNSLTEDFIPPALNVEVAIRLATKPEAIIRQPEGEWLKVEYADGIAKVMLPRLDIHSALEVR